MIIAVILSSCEKKAYHHLYDEISVARAVVNLLVRSFTEPTDSWWQLNYGYTHR